MPRVYIIPGDSPNAFATGRNPENAAVAATEGLIRNLSTEELAGVMAHELAHVRNRDILISSIAATLAATIMVVARMAQFAMIFSGGENRRENIVSFLATLILAPIAAMLIQAAISRSREFVADKIGAEIAGTPEGTGKCASTNRKCSKGFANGCKSSDSTHVHHDAFLETRINVPFQHTSADRRANKKASWLV